MPAITVSPIRRALVAVAASAVLIVSAIPAHAADATGGELMAPVYVTGSSNPPIGCSRRDVPGSGDLGSVYTCDTDAGLAWLMSDPRLTGRVTRVTTELGIRIDDIPAVVEICDADPRCSVPGVIVRSSAYTIENDDGSWHERPRMWMSTINDLGIGEREVIVLDGAGGYEGLVAVLESTGRHRGFEGFILDARHFPPPPDGVSRV